MATVAAFEASIAPRKKRPALPRELRSTFRQWTAERGFPRDMAELALRLCKERIAPAKKDSPVQFDLPPMQSAADAATAVAAVLDAVAVGELTPAEGAHVMALVEGYRRTLETSEIEARVAELERAGR